MIPARRQSDRTPIVAPASLLLGTVLLCLSVVGAFALRRDGGMSDADYERSGRGLTVSLDAMSQWDGRAYLGIATNGYSYDPERASNVAYFPFYPLTIAAVTAATQLEERIAAILISTIAFITSGLLLTCYLSPRFDSAQVTWSVAAMALFPTSFFFHMAYSESLFIFLLLLCMIAYQSRWHWVITAAIVGLTCAARPVGIAALCFLPSIESSDQKSGRRVMKRGLALVIGLGGLLGYMAFQWRVFNDPLAFAKTQQFYQMRPAQSLGAKAMAYATWEPIWSVYDSQSVAYWNPRANSVPALWNLRFANPIIWLLMCGLVATGIGRGLLTRREAALSVLLLAIPYVTRGFEMCMMSQGRFAAVCIPAYIVLGNLLSSASQMWRYTWCMVSIALFVVYTALFARGYMLI